MPGSTSGENLSADHEEYRLLKNGSQFYITNKCLIIVDMELAEEENHQSKENCSKAKVRT